MFPCRRLLHFPRQRVPFVWFQAPTNCVIRCRVFSRANECEIVAMNHTFSSSLRIVEHGRRRLAAHPSRFHQMAAVVLFRGAGCRSHAVEPLLQLRAAATRLLWQRDEAVSILWLDPALQVGLS